MPRRPAIPKLGRLLAGGFRAAVFGACLLSLLMCLGTGWQWWRGRATGYSVTVSFGGGWRVDAALGNRTMEVWVFRHWPEPTRVRLRSESLGSSPADPYDDDREHVGFCIWSGLWAPERRGLWDVSGGSARAFVAADGRAREVTMREAVARMANGTGMAPPTPFWLVENIRDGQIMAVTAVPPLLWLAATGRRAWVRRRRRRLGRCLACGYDLRGTPSGRCSECGTVIPDGRGKGIARSSSRP